MSVEVNFEEIKQAALEFQALLIKKKLKMKNTIIMDRQRIRAKIFRSDDYVKLCEDE